jgi:hypothetical protein
VEPALQHATRQKEGSRFVGDGEFRGENEPYGALLTYSLNLPGLPHPREEKERERKEKEREAARKPVIPESGVPPEDIPKEPEAKPAPDPKPPEDDKEPQVDFEVTDASGKVIRKFKGPAKLGVNRTSWDLRRDAFKRPKVPGEEENEFQQRTGPEVLAGTYTITLKFRGNEAKQPVTIVPDARDSYTADARQAKNDALVRAGKLQETATEAINRINKTRAEIDAVLARAKKDDEPPSSSEKKEPDPLTKSGGDLKKKLDAMEKRLWVPPKTKGIVAETDVWSKISYPLGSMQSSWDAPTPSQLAYLTYAEEALRAVIADFNKLYAEDVARFREAASKVSLNEPELTIP